MKDEKKNKSVDELTQERDTLIQEIANLTEKKGNLSVDKSIVSENENLKTENKQLRELIEKYKEDVKNANELVVQTLREYSTKTNDPKFFNGDDGKTEEQKNKEEAENSFNEFIKNI